MPKYDFFERLLDPRRFGAVLQKLLRGARLLRVQDAQLFHPQILLCQPDAQQPLRKIAVDSRFLHGIACQVGVPLHLFENGKQPGAVSVQHTAGTDHHIGRIIAHAVPEFFVKDIQIVWVQFADGLFGLQQVFFAAAVQIGLPDPTVGVFFPGHQHIVVLQQIFYLSAIQNMLR